MTHYVDIVPTLMRPLGKMPIGVSSIGLGCWGLCDGWGGRYPEAYISSILDAARDRGINFFDTAGVYGNGLGETILNKRWKYHVVIATKISAEEKPAHPIQSIRKYYEKRYCLTQVENALRRLGRDYIDILYFHNWYPNWSNEVDYMLEILLELKASGKVRAVGVSVPEQMHYDLSDFPFIRYVDTVQLSLNIFEQNALGFINLIKRECNISIIAKSALKQGLFAQGFGSQKIPHFASRNYDHWKQHDDWVKRIRQACDIVNINASRLPYYALAYVLSIAEVSSVLVGMRRLNHVIENTRKENFLFDEDALRKGSALPGVF